MHPNLHSTDFNAAWPTLLWLAAVIALALLMPHALSSALAEAPASSVATDYLPSASTGGAGWQVEHEAIDWSKLPVEPNPGSLSVAAYDR